MQIVQLGAAGMLTLLGVEGGITDAAWYIETVDTEGSVGQYNSLALDADDNPHISYQDGSKEDLKYASWDGAEWEVQRTDSIGKVGEYTSIAVDAFGYPHISYATAFWNWEPVLRYSYLDGNGWHIQNVDSVYHRLLGRHSSLALDDEGRPHISYEDRDLLTPTSRMKYACRGVGGWQFDVVDPGPYAGSYGSLVLDHLGRPHVSYHADGVLRYAWWDGAAWQIETVDQPESLPVELGMHSSLALDSGGNPHVSYCESWYDNPPVVETRVKYAHHDGVAWQIETLDGWGAAATHAALALDENDRPYVGYYYDSWQPSVRELRVTWHDGTAWNIACVDSGVRASWDGRVSLALGASSSVHISYYDHTVQDLKYAFGTPLEEGEDPGKFSEACHLSLEGQSPCLGGVRVVLHLDQPAHVSLGIYDLLGRRVHLLHNGFVPEGSHRMMWNGVTGVGSRVSSGVYLWSAVAGQNRASTRLVLLH